MTVEIPNSLLEEDGALHKKLKDFKREVTRHRMRAVYSGLVLGDRSKRECMRIISERFGVSFSTVKRAVQPINII